RREQFGGLPVELDARDVRWGLRARKDVDDEHIDLAAQAGREPPEHRPRIAVAHPDRGCPVPWQLLADKVDVPVLDLDHLLPGAGPRRGDMTGEGERARAEMHRGGRRIGRPDGVDDVPHPPDVLKERLARVVEEDVRLWCAVDDEFGRAALPAV